MERVSMLIIGSGFGGVVMVCWLVEKGDKVVVLEWGWCWLLEDYFSVSQCDWLWDEDELEQQNGWLDFWYFGDMSVVLGVGVGGGLLIYVNVSVVLLLEVFECGWLEVICFDILCEYFWVSGEMFNVQILLDYQWILCICLMYEVVDKFGQWYCFCVVFQVVSFDLDWYNGLDNVYSYGCSKIWINVQGCMQGICVYCGNCDLGCLVWVKNILDLNYLVCVEE